MTSRMERKDGNGERRSTEGKTGGIDNRGTHKGKERGRKRKNRKPSAVLSNAPSLWK